MTNVIRNQNAYWIYLVAVGYKEDANKELEGKYLFFSPSQKTLLDLLKQEIMEESFMIGKVARKNISGDFVCCLYWTDDTRKQELWERYQEREDIKYRGWKSNAATRAGIFSEKYKEALKRHIPDVMEDPIMDSAFTIFHE